MKFRSNYVFIIVTLIFFFSIGLIIGCFFSIRKPTFSVFFRSPQVVAWAKVIATLFVVFLALFLNILRGDYQRPRFNITYDSIPPYQVVTNLSNLGESEQILHVRLCVQNIGRTVVEACEVRIERVFKIEDNELVMRNDHDPRALKWAGRDASPIALSPGAFDFVDLGALNSTLKENFILDFCDRGHLDLNIADSRIKGFQLQGSVYGKNAVPKQFELGLAWEASEILKPVKIWKV